jgi:acyl-homoserine-lactone acylase
MTHSLASARLVHLLAALVLLPLLALVTPVGPAGAQAPDEQAPDEQVPDEVETRPGELSATIRWTDHGIPHITAADFAGIGYGYGYAIARDNICVLADSYVTVNAERSKYFGADEGYTFEGNGFRANNLNSDFFFARIKAMGTVEDLIAQPPPHGPVQGAKDGVRGYVAGYNRYLAEVGVDGIPDPRCRGAQWVRPITEMDAYRRFYQLALLASGGVAIDGIGGAQPTLDPAAIAQAEQAHAAGLEQLRTGEIDLRDLYGGLGSNAYGIGRDGTRNGRGLVVGNPHFPWQGSERFYQAHLTIPGEVDVAGGSLYGVPLILIGHTEGLAWSHTVSTAFRFTPFELTINPTDPTSYLVDGEPRQMEAHELSVEVRDDDGTLSTETRTLYTTEYGPMLTDLVGIPLPWTPLKAFAMGDANAGNFRYINHFFEKNQAQSVAELHEVLTRNQGIPWVNTIAADAEGGAYYADISVVPHVTDDMLGLSPLNGCTTAVGQLTLELARLPVLDGSRSACAWGTDDDALQPGTFGPGNLPHLFRDDYVNNANDSYWLTNPAEPLEGFAEIIGDERTPRSLRTRSNLVLAEQRIAGTDDISAEPGFDADTAAALAFGNRVHAAELMRDDLVAMCREQAGPPTHSEEACDVLDAWDLRANLDSRGTHLFREFIRFASGATGGMWRDSFDADDPVHTPRALNTDHPEVREALVDAVDRFTSRGIPLDAPFGALQSEARGEQRIPIHGGGHAEGIFNVISAPFDGETGTYPDVRHGSSFVQVVHFTDGCPDVRTILTYSQSTSPESPWYADQTEMFSAKEWVRPPFCEADVQAETLESVTISEVDLAVDRVAGATRIETAAQISQRTFDRAETVVLARAGDYPDALAGAPLAAALDGPLLLTDSAVLSPAARAEILRLQAARVVVLGGTAALSEQVVTDLTQIGAEVERIFGFDRFATAAEIARRLGSTSPVAFIAEGAHSDPARGWPDALAAAPYAAAQGHPILLVTRDSIPPETAVALSELGVTEAIVVGGPNAVGDGVFTGLAAYNPRRLAGATRYATSAAVFSEAVERGADDAEIWLTTGRSFPDALAAGPAVAARGASLMLIDPESLAGSPPTSDLLAARAGELARVRLVGGTAAISEAVEAEVRALLQ